MLDLHHLHQRFASRYPNTYTTVDSHTQGEPTRLLVGGDYRVGGATMAQKRDHFIRHYDHLRLMLTREPRGHRDMFAAVVTEPVSVGAAFGLIYMDARRYPYLCGHGTIGAITTLVELGLVATDEGDQLIVVDTPSGPLEARTQIAGGRVEAVTIAMVPSFVFATDLSLEVKGHGRVEVDLVYVGGFFAMVAAAGLHIDLHTADRAWLTGLGMAIIEAANTQLTVRHPERVEVNTIDVVEFYQEESDTSGASVVIYGEAHMDRSPCGTGTTAKMTLLHQRRQLAAGAPYTNRSPLGTAFTGEIAAETSVGDYPAVVCTISASAVITGEHRFVIDTADPFPHGFLL